MSYKSINLSLRNTELFPGLRMEYAFKAWPTDVPLPVKSKRKKDRKDFIVKPIKHSEAIKSLATTYLQGEFKRKEDFLHLFSKGYMDYQQKGDNIYLQISMMALRLSYYYDIDHKDHGGNIIDYLKFSLLYGPQYAKYIKDIRELAFIKSTSVKLHSSFEDEWKSVEQLNMWPRLDREIQYSYDDFLHQQYLLHFEEDTADFLWSIEAPEEDEAVIDIFRQVARDLINRCKVDQLRHPSNDEKSFWISDSTTFDESKKKNVVNRTLIRDKYKEEDLEHLTPNGRFVFNRTKIQVGPANCRDSWSNDLNTLFTTKHLSYLLKQVIAPMEYSAMGCDTITALKRKRLLVPNYDALFIMLDYKKCGLTVNRRLLSILGEILSEIYEDDFFLNLKCFESCVVYDSGNKVVTRRGTGLGNCNEGITLIQCVIGECLNKFFGYTSIFFNDDGVIRISSRKYAEQFIKTLTFIKGLGMLVNLKKTFISDSNVFCEEYYIAEDKKFNYSKKQLSLIPYSYAFFQRTIHEAKRFFFGMNRLNVGQRIDDTEVLNCLVKFYGYEFFKAEYAIPYHFGGWRDWSESNFSCIFDFLVHPKRYLNDPLSRSQYKILGEWIYFLCSRIHQRSLLSEKAEIPYRVKVKNLLEKDFYLSLYSDLSEWVYKFSGRMTQSDLEDMSTKVINTRGLHNAKPSILTAISYKEEARRKMLLRKFQEHHEDILGYIHDDITMSYMVTVVKSFPDAPDYYMIPITSYVPGFNVDSFSLRKNLIYSKAKIKDALGNDPTDDDINRTLASIENRQWLSGSDMFCFSGLHVKLKSGYLISNLGVHRGGEVLDLPFWYKVLCPNKILASSEVISRLRNIPFGIESIPDRPIRNLLLMKYSCSRVFPGSEILVKSLVSEFPNRLRDIRDLYKNQNIKNIREFKIYTDVIRRVLLENPLGDRNVVIDEADQDILDYVNWHLDDDLFREYFSEGRTIEDLITHQNPEDTFFPEWKEDESPRSGEETGEEPYADIDELLIREDLGYDVEEDDLLADEVRRLNREDFD